MLLQLRTELRSQQGLIELLEHFLDLRAGLIGEIVLRVVELVARIDGVADAGDRQVGHDVLAQLFEILISRDLLLRAGSVFKAHAERVALGAKLVEIGPNIGQF